MTLAYLQLLTIEISVVILNVDLPAIHEWSEKWLVTFSEAKILKKSHKHIDVTFSHNLSWTSHIDEVRLKAMKLLDII